MSSPTSRSASPTDADVERFLTELHGEAIADLESLSGGFWSSAHAYRVGDEELVARFGQERDWFEIDRAAMAYSSADLPVPEVLDVGEAPFGGVFAISRRHHGRFLEDVRPDEVASVGPMLRRLLAALAAVPPGDGPSWRAWLCESLEEHPGPTFGWRAKLAAIPEADAAFEAAVVRIRELAAGVPERRDLVHGDLLHRNVLVSDDASRVNAVFSWKCSVRGDHLYDTAWCTFWGARFHPGIAAIDLAADLTDDERARHHCYELHIAANHLGWNAWVDDHDALSTVLDATNALLTR